MNLPVEVRIRQLELNMERWRWLPRQMGDLHILVDIAGFQLRLIEKNRVVMASPVIVGQPNWQTEVFNSKIKSFVLNPCWVIPESITIGEMVPLIRENLRFLAENKIEVEKGPEHTHNNNIDPMTVDWKQVGSGKPDFILVQKKGGTNPMGVIKFIVSDDRSIYIHDTPQKELFKNEMRLFSHGCVRMKDPLKLAAYLAGSNDLASAEWEITEKIMSDEEATVPLKNPVPVYFAYLTAAVDEEGTLYFRPDVYGHDIPLYRAMLANNLFTD